MQHLTKFWSDRGDTIIKFDYEDVKARIGNEEYAKCLSENGLPEETAPYLNFDNRSYKSKEFILAEGFENSNNYFVIGFTGSGNGICIEADTGRIVWVDADEGGIYLINSSLGQLYKCMQCYAEFMKETTEYTEEVINSLEDKFKEIDEMAVEMDENEYIWPFWAEEIDRLYGDL